MNEELAKARAILDEDSWIEEFSILDDDGEPDDCACRVVRVDDMRDALDRIEAAAKRERERLRAALKEALDYCESDQRSGIAYSDNDVLVPMLRAALGAGETPTGKGVGE